MAEAGNFNRLQQAGDRRSMPRRRSIWRRRSRRRRCPGAADAPAGALGAIKPLALPAGCLELPVNLPERIDLERTALGSGWMC